METLLSNGVSMNRTELLDPKVIDKKALGMLPTFIETYARADKPQLDDTFLQLLAYWTRSLEYAHYKAFPSWQTKVLDKRLDRVLLFLQAVRENPEKDGALMMATWRFRFAMLETYLYLKAQNITIGDERAKILDRLCHPKLKVVKTINSLISAVQKTGERVTYERVLEHWKAYRVLSEGKEPGAIATQNFYENWLYFWTVFEQRGSFEGYCTVLNSYRSFQQS